MGDEEQTKGAQLRRQIIAEGERARAELSERLSKMLAEFVRDRQAAIRKNDERNAAIVGAIVGGKSFAAVARDYDLSRGRVRQICNAMGISVRIGRVRLLDESAGDEMLVMHKNGATEREIVRAIGCSISQVRSALEARGVTTTKGTLAGRAASKAALASFLIGRGDMRSAEIAKAVGTGIEYVSQLKAQIFEAGFDVPNYAPGDTGSRVKAAECTAT